MTDFDHLDTKYVSAFYTNLFNSPARCYLQGNVETHLLCGATVSYTHLTLPTILRV